MSTRHDSAPIQFDWESAKRRIQATRQTLSQVEHLTEQQADELMRQRAQQLARLPAATPDTSEVMEIVRFRLGNELFAVATPFVKELRRPSSITPIPDSDPSLVGVVNLRGDVTSVWDLRRLLGLKGQPEPQPQVLVLGRMEPELAIVVDAMEHVLTIRLDEIQQPIGGIGNARELVRGCTSEGVMVLDGEALLLCEALYIDQSD